MTIIRVVRGWNKINNENALNIHTDDKRVILLYIKNNKLSSTPTITQNG